MMNPLVLMPCSGRKAPVTETVLLHCLYDGPIWRTLRTHRGEVPWANVLVLSAHYGWARSDRPGMPYERRLTAAEADRLVLEGLDAVNYWGSTVGAELLGADSTAPWDLVLVAGASHYERAMLALVGKLTEVEWVAPGCPVLRVAERTGGRGPGIGTQRARLGRWLDGVRAASMYR